MINTFKYHHEHSEFHEWLANDWSGFHSLRRGCIMYQVVSSKQTQMIPCFGAPWRHRKPKVFPYVPRKTTVTTIIHQFLSLTHTSGKVEDWLLCLLYKFVWYIFILNRECNDSWLYIQLWVMYHIHMGSWLHSNSLHVSLSLSLSPSPSLPIAPLWEFSILLKASLPTYRISIWAEVFVGWDSDLLLLRAAPCLYLNPLCIVVIPTRPSWQLHDGIP